jgi:putative FmdB family regulatory protein
VPTYEYACTDCGERHEIVQRFTDPTLTECPSCTGRLRKVFSPVGVVFKGSGFYKTDSRSSSGSGSARSDDGGTAKTDGKTDTKSDAKSETGGSKSDAKASGDSARVGVVDRVGFVRLRLDRLGVVGLGVFGVGQAGQAGGRSQLRRARACLARPSTDRCHPPAAPHLGR